MLLAHYGQSPEDTALHESQPISMSSSIINESDRDESNRTHTDPKPTEQTSSKGPISQKEIGGREGPEPTRFGDWEKNGRCIDF